MCDLGTHKEAMRNEKKIFGTTASAFDTLEEEAYTLP
jgi:hypothetical protein